MKAFQDEGATRRTHTDLPETVTRISVCPSGSPRDRSTHPSLASKPQGSNPQEARNPSSES